MRTTATRFLSALMVLLLAGLASAASSAEIAPSNLAAIEAARVRLESSTLSEAERQIVSNELSVSAALDREASALVERLAELRSAIAGLPAQAQVLQQSLGEDRERSLEDWRKKLPGLSDVESLELMLERERATLIELDRQIRNVSHLLTEALSRPPQGSEITALQQRIEELAALVVPSGEAAAVGEARQLRRAVELRRQHAELALRLTEQDSGAAWQRHYELQLRELRYRRTLHLSRVTLLQDAIVERGRRQLQARIASLEQQKLVLTSAPEPVALAAQTNAGIGAQLVYHNERLASERRILNQAEQARASLTTALSDSQIRLQLASKSEHVGQWLWRERQNLESPRSVAQSLSRARGRLVELRLDLIELNEQRRDLADIEAAASRLLVATTELDGLDAGTADTDTDTDSATDADRHLGELKRLLQERVELLEQLEPLIRRHIATLEQTAQTLQAQLDGSLELRQMLDRHLLWIPSHGPVDSAWLSRVPAGVYDLFKPSRFVTSINLVAENFAQQPITRGATVLMVLALFWLQRRVRPALTALAQPMGRIRTDRYQHTAKALAWTLLAALPWAATFWLLGDILKNVGSSGRYSDSLGRALSALIPFILAFAFLFWASVEHGLGHKHFRWARARRDSLRRWMPRVSALLPLYFIIQLAFIRNQELAIDVQARMALVLLCGAAALVAWRMLAADQLWAQRGASSESSPLRKLLRTVLLAGLLAVTVLALAGYVYSAAVLIRALFESVVLAAAVMLLQGLLARWFMVGERHLVLRRLEQQQQAALSATGGGGESGEVALPDLDKEVAIETISAQSQRLLRALQLVLLTAGLIWVWASLLPAVSRLDEIALWHFSDVSQDGVKVSLPVTLMGFVLGLLTLALTFVAARNLPGLIEIGLLSQARMDRAARYAITSLARYAIVITGVLIGMGLLGLRWSQLQWMAAALTVGLGFGLQEIFANFVSGLILLFERPFRVGDTITVGDQSGTVTRIHTRATTILDFDNKEIVVPNKNFITGQLINWTLSDNTIRLTIKVGVAYGSDVSKTHQLLIQAAEEHPSVLPEPAPRSLFYSFGDSALDFELRVFVGAIIERLIVQNDLNGRIAELFAANGIEIAFPQLDLHVRDLPASACAVDPKPGAAGDGK